MPGRKRREDSRYRGGSRRLAHLIRDARAEKGVTQQALASSAEVAVSTVRKVESNAVVEPGFFTVLAICQALQVDVADFIRAERDMS